jgi:diguanylate cyclase (GGDEF)-like protein
MAGDEGDYVTGLESRRRFEAAIEDLLRRSTPMSIVIVDVVGLKRVNEEQGFLAGDRVLEEAADRLRAATATTPRPQGLYRLGGDELVALYAGTEAGHRADQAARMLTRADAGPSLRVGATAARPGDTRATLLDRLYATARRS